jgi:hypothetical protein
MTDFGGTEDIQMDEFEDSVDGTTGAVGGQEETDFGGGTIQTQAEVHGTEASELPNVPDGTEIKSTDNLRVKKEFYESLDIGWEIDPNAALEHGITFEKDPKTKHVYAKYRDENSILQKVQLTDKRNPSKYVALRTISQRFGVSFVRDKLGVKNFRGGSLPKIDPQEATALNQVRDNTPAADDDVPLIDVSDRIDDVHESIANLSTEMREVGITTDITYTSQEWRDIIALDKTLQTQKGQINVLISRMAVIDQQIQELSSGAAEDITPDDIEETRTKIVELREKRNTYSELVSTYESKIRSQFSRIRETINRMLYQDETLGERVKTLFREQGITIVSIITALGLAISAIVEGILLATKSVGNAITPKPPPQSLQVPNQDQHQLQHQNPKG